MSLPTELREQLLSGYLDDALSRDERARVEQLLERDEDFAADLAELRQLRQMLKVIAQSDANIKLDSGFTDRILDAAVAQARAEGLEDTHPLVRLAEQPSAPRSVRRTSYRRAATVLIGLAASIAIAAFAMRPGDQDPIAEIPPTGAESAVAASVPVIPVGPGVGTDVSDDVDSALDNQLGPLAPPEHVATSNSDSAPTLTDDSSTTGRMELPPNRNNSLPATDSIAQSEANGSQNNVASNSNDNNRGDPPSVGALEDMLLGGSPVVVYSVRLTALGRENDAVGKAMLAASIDASSEKKVTDSITGFLNNQSEPAASTKKAKVLFLQAPLKSLDRLYLNLMADEEGIEAVGMTVAFNAPIAKVANALRVDPVTVQHDGRLLELASETGMLDQLAMELDQLPFDFSRNSELTKPVLNNDGPDEMGQIMVLVYDN